MTARKINPGTLRRSSPSVRVRVNKARFEALQKLLADGCHRLCDYDEAEGGIMNHCDDCQCKITTIAYELFVDG